MEEGNLGRVLAAQSSDKHLGKQNPSHFCRPQSLTAGMSSRGHYCPLVVSLDSNAEGSVPLGCSKCLGRKTSQERYLGARVRTGKLRITLPLASLSLSGQASQHGNHQKPKPCGVVNPAPGWSLDTRSFNTTAFNMLCVLDRSDSVS